MVAAIVLFAIACAIVVAGMLGSKDENDAIRFADTLSSSGITATVFVSTDWSNLNQEKFYVVSAGAYSTEDEANEALKTVQNLGYSSAYVKYSGDFLGSN